MGFLYPLFFKDSQEQQKFIFTLYDIDADGIISSADLVQVQAHVTPSSVLGEELEVMADHIVFTRIKSTLLRDSDLINFFNFNFLVYKSCLTDELK
jgi:Ca2+-binding EF-hand superfamily protein